MVKCSSWTLGVQSMNLGSNPGNNRLVKIPAKSSWEGRWVQPRYQKLRGLWNNSLTAFYSLGQILHDWQCHMPIKTTMADDAAIQPHWQVVEQHLKFEFLIRRRLSCDQAWTSNILLEFVRPGNLLDLPWLAKRSQDCAVTWYWSSSPNDGR